jgi:riboflavin transporter FmnP
MENRNIANGNQKNPSVFELRNLVQIGILSAVAFLLMSLEIPLWFAPSFYKLDLSELPALIGAFAMGPLAGIMIELLKVVLYFFLHGSATLGVGDLANFIMGCCLVVPAALLYRWQKTKRNAMVGMALGTVLMAAVAWLVNAFVLLPLYAAVFHMPMTALIAMGTQVNPAVVNLATFVLLIVVPFNLLKGAVVSLLTLLLYKRVSPILHGKLR